MVAAGPRPGVVCRPGDDQDRYIGRPLKVIGLHQDAPTAWQHPHRRRCAGLGGFKAPLASTPLLASRRYRHRCLTYRDAGRQRRKIEARRKRQRPPSWAVLAALFHYAAVLAGSSHPVGTVPRRKCRLRILFCTGYNAVQHRRHDRSLRRFED